MVFEIVNSFLCIFNTISSDKSCLISIWRQDTIIFPACWILIGQFKFPARQPYARLEIRPTNKEATISLYAMFVYNARREDWIQENDV